MKFTHSIIFFILALMISSCYYSTSSRSHQPRQHPAVSDQQPPRTIRYNFHDTRNPKPMGSQLAPRSNTFPFTIENKPKTLR
jgi:hypothetical protein